MGYRLRSGYEMLCRIWYQLYNLKNVKNTHGGVLLLVNEHSFMGVFYKR